MAKPTIFSIADIRGGINDSDSPTLLAQNQVVDARNIDFRDGALGSKRRGTVGVDLTSAIFDSPVMTLIRHTPDNTVGNDELWGIDENGNIDRRVGGTWQGGVATVNDHVTINAVTFFDANGVSLHGKLFIAANGPQDRLIVWDGTVLRWAGFWQTPDPSVADTAVAGTYSGTRYFRVRYVQQVGGVVVRRSEPSNTISFVPNGAFNGAVITKPAGTEATTSVFCEGQTHWEVEASIDNILFYRIATVVIGTSTYTDTTAFVTGYSTNPLSEQIGEYVPPHCPRHVAVDEDRLLIGGSHFSTALDSTVKWTPVGADDGVGNDERVPTATLQFIAFDGLDGGRVTGLVAGVAGNVYVFKSSRIYKMVRTGVAESAYQPITESFSRGSTLRGAVAGNDPTGVPCVYFLDPALGLCRVGQRGVEDQISEPVRDTWKRRVSTPIVRPRILYYPELEHVWYSVPLDDADIPNRLFKFETRYGANLYDDGVPATALAFTLFPDSDQVLRPFIGTELVNLPGGGTTYIHQADIGADDTGVDFRAYVITKPYALGDLWTKFGLMAGILMGRAQSGTEIFVRLIRNLGLETPKELTVSLTPVGSESHVMRPMDNASASELNTVQIEYGDEAAGEQQWSLDQMTFRVRSEEGSA